MNDFVGEDQRLLALMKRVAAGELAAESALEAWHEAAFDGFSRDGAAGIRLDLGRGARTGFPEVVYGEGKTPTDLRRIAEALLAKEGRLLVTRASAEQARALEGLRPACTWHERARVIAAGIRPPTDGPVVGVLCAGTTDVPVAEEAALTVEAMGVRALRIYDVGVAGLHRLLARRGDLAGCDVVIVVAGMEGALPSVVGGLVDVPLIAVPTSVGYGAAFRGLSALLAMLGSCAPGVVAVNIDNGFGAGFAAGRWIAAMRAVAQRPDARSGCGSGPADDPTNT